MPRVYKRPDRPADSFWWIEFRDESKRKRRERVGPSKRQAQDLLSQRLVEVRDRKYAPAKVAADTLFRDVALLYIRDVAPGLMSRARVAGIARTWIDHLGPIRLRELTPQVVQAYQAKRARERTPATVNREIAGLKRICNLAIEWGLLSANPCAGIRKLREGASPGRPLTHEEAARLVKAAGEIKGRRHDIRPLLIVALNTGARLGELKALRWVDVDLDHAVMSFPVTKAGRRRDIRINRDVVTALRGIPRESEHVFAGPGGGPISDLRTGFVRVCKDAGLPGLRFHDLRHTFASHAIMAGIPMETVKTLLGHSTFSMVARYAHLSDQHMADAVQLVSLGADTHADTTPPDRSTMDTKRERVKS